jgi:hypothetical protein
MMHVNDPETGIIMFTIEGNNEYICQSDVEIFGDGPSFNHFPITDSSLLYSVARPRLCIFRHQAWVK